MNGKQRIIQLFNENVRNQPIIITEAQHCGSIGHWLETRMNLSHNSNNSPDIDGYEMKKHSKKISFGDFSASEYAFTSRKRRKYLSEDFDMTRTEFIQYFGNENVSKNRYSWSGTCVPKYGVWNEYGQTLLIESKDICIFYSFNNDMREIKHTFPEWLKKDVVIAIWKKEKMEKHIQEKFDVNGFFICKMTNNVFTSICFGDCFNYDAFLDGIRQGVIIFDSGMVSGNRRNYSHFRSVSDTFWMSLVTEEY